MRRATSLIEAQDRYIDRVLNAKPYRDRPNWPTFLNRKVATLRAAGRQYREDLRALGFDEGAIELTLKDARDVAKLMDSARD